jgi:hypothetical protein
MIFVKAQIALSPMKNPRPGKPQTLAPAEILIQYEFVQMFTEHLTDCWQVFNGDLTEMIVLAVLGQAQLGALRREKEQLDLAADFPVQGMSASRLSDVSGIPRQTVRRKLLQMQKKGWAVQQDDGCWNIAITDGRVPVREALDGLHARGIVRAKRLATNLKNLV